MSRLENKIALITGAAGGIGQATARLFVAQGAGVVLVDRDRSRLDETAASLASDRVLCLEADTGDGNAVEKMVESAEDVFGRIDIAVFNAGIAGANMPLEEYPVDLFDEVLAVNMRGPWLGMRAVIPLMKRQRAGSIILTSSIQGLSALPGTTAYTTSKHALVGMMKGAALELAGANVRVNTVHPGYVATPMMDAIHGAVSPDNPEAFRDALAGTVPMGRYATPEEIASLVLFLGSDESGYCTGGCYTADGGILAALPSL